MRVLLVDVDSTIPNLALMRLSAFHNDANDEVSFLRLSVSYYPHKRAVRKVDTSGYDRVYLSAIFKGTINSVRISGDCADVRTGGTGVDVVSTLGNEVDSYDPDYSIYPENDTAYGFISRGCNRKCYFCVVPEKEGKTHQVETDINRIVGRFGKVKFMDNNFLQLPNHVEILRNLVARGIRCQFNQGLDIRLITPENSELLSRLNYMGEYLFAFDDYKYRRMMERQLALLNWIKPWKAKFYCYVNPDMADFETVKRVMFLRERKLLPYVMRDITCWSSSKSEFYTDLAAWANQPSVFKKMGFLEFLDRRHDDLFRVVDSATNWLDAAAVRDKPVFSISPV